jgi:hypothetical protein
MVMSVPYVNVNATLRSNLIRDVPDMGGIV